MLDPRQRLDGLQWSSVELAAQMRGAVTRSIFKPEKWEFVHRELVAGEITTRGYLAHDAPMNVTELSSVAVASGNYAVVDDALLIGEAMSHNPRHNVRGFFNLAADGKYTFRIPEKDRRQTSARGLHFLCGGHQNFWHYFFNFAARLHFFKTELGRGDFAAASFIVPKLRPLHRGVFELLGVAADRLIELELGQIHAVERLIVCESPVYMDDAGLHAARGAYDFLQELPSRAEADLGERVYISRRDADWRRVINEDALIEMLAPLGFKVLINSAVSLPDLIAIMRRARVVVSPSGANLASTLFCDSGAKVVELSYEHMIDKYYFALSSALCGHQHYKLRGEVSDGGGKSYARSNFRVDLEATKQLLGAII